MMTKDQIEKLGRGITDLAIMNIGAIMFPHEPPLSAQEIEQYKQTLIAHYQNDPIFNARVKALVAQVMLLTEDVLS